MGIGAIGAVGGVGFQPYIYNVNTVSSSSLNRVNAIGSDVAKAPSTDYSALYDEGENINPLRKGETKNFADILASQMAMSRLHAERLMPQAAEQADQMDQAAVALAGGQSVA